MKYFDKDFLEIVFNNNVGCVIMTWKQFANGEKFREGLNAGLDLLIEKKASRWLADMRKMQAIPVPEQEWSNTDWFPRAINGGVRKMALVHPKSAIANMGVKNIMQKVMNVELEINNFDNVDEAIAWLAS